MTRRRRTEAGIAPTLARITYWQGLKPHDEVRVKGKPRQRSHYEFLAFVQNVVSGECFIEVLGGRLGRDGTHQRNIRMFPPERCSAPPRKRPRRKAPDTAVAQLSFDDLAPSRLHDGR
ncbi:MAG TPA: hypothetical protein VMU99_10160 [Acidimicrobiales bacterium]|nr:hypothetical protein [Acidimicrobiales bacterium]